MIREQFDLSNKVAVVAGGRGFLGRRFSAALAEFGANVFSVDIPQTSLAAKSDQGFSQEFGIVQRTVDVTDENSVRTLVDSIVEETSRIDVLVYSVKTSSKGDYKSFTECSLDDWRTLLQVELDGLFLLTQSVGRVMETMGHGSIIFISSIYGIVGNDQRIYEGANLAELYAGDNDERPERIYSPAAYAATKGAVISLTRFLAAYWGEMGIRVNCISPGGVGHPGENEEFIRKYSERVPLGRKAGLDEISAALVYLASNAGSYVTGHNLVIDGGWTAW